MGAQLRKVRERRSWPAWQLSRAEAISWLCWFQLGDRLADIADKVRSFGFGADDYMTKPFHKDELVARLMRYSRKRYDRCAFVYAFARQWLDDEQSVRTAKDLEAARAELAQNASFRIAASDRILNSRIF